MMDRPVTASGLDSLCGTFRLEPVTPVFCKAKVGN